MRSQVLNHCGALAVAGAILNSLSVVGATDTFATPSFRGQPGTTFDGWDQFTVGVGAPGNTGELPGSSGNATLYQWAAGALVPGSGNIYNGSEASRFEIRYSADQPVEQVVFQARTLGTEFNYDSVRLFAWTDSLSTTRTEIERAGFGGPPGTPGSGFSVTSSWTWDIGSLDATTFAIAFDAAEINLSLDSAMLDVKSVPEPGPVVLGLLGLAVLGGLRRRR